MELKEILILSILIVSSIQDIRTREVSNLASLFLIIIGLININQYKIIAFFIITFPFLLLNFKNEKIIGAGDVKIISGICLNFGFYKSLIIIMCALFISSVITILLKKNSQPVVPYLLIGYLISIVL